MTTLAKGQPDMTLIPNYALGGATAALLSVALLGLVLIIFFRLSPRSLADQVALAKVAAIGVLGIGACGFVILFVAGLQSGW
jgi:hypothetical protein